MQARSGLSRGAYFGPKNVGEAFTHPDAHAIVLTMLLLKEFGREYLAWEPETLWFEINRTWKRDPSVVNRTKIQACRTILVAPSSYEDYGVFEAIAFGLVGQPPIFDMMQKADPFKCLFALDCIKALNSKAQVSPEVYKYCAASMHAAGFAFCPGSMEPANKHLRYFVGPDLQNSVDLILSSDHTTVPRGSALALQAGKSQMVADFSTVQRRALAEQVKRLLPRK